MLSFAERFRSAVRSAAPRSPADPSRALPSAFALPRRWILAAWAVGILLALPVALRVYAAWWDFIFGAGAFLETWLPKVR